MVIDGATFVLEYPEFLECYDTAPRLIQRALRQGAAFCDSGVWGSRYADGVFCKAAEILAMTPFGENARLKGDPSTSGYAITFAQMLQSLPIRIGLAGGVGSDLDQSDV